MNSGGDRAAVDELAAARGLAPVDCSACGGQGSRDLPNGPSPEHAIEVRCAACGGWGWGYASPDDPAGLLTPEQLERLDAWQRRAPERRAAGEAPLPF